MRDPSTGEIRGPAYELARELAHRNNVPLEFKPIAGPPAQPAGFDLLASGIGRGNPMARCERRKTEAGFCARYADDFPPRGPGGRLTKILVA
jgi:hypothetical protein